MKEKYIYEMFNYGLNLGSENNEYTDISDSETTVVNHIKTKEAKELKGKSDKMLNFILELNEKFGDNREFSELFYEFKEKEV